MKILLSYKFQGEDLNNLETMLTNIKNILEKNGNKVLTTFFDSKNLKNNREIMDLALKKADEADTQLIILTSNEKSEGLILETGYAIAKKKKIILAQKEGIKTKWIEHYATRIIEFKDLKDLYNQLEDIK